jgi:hypothetical protein
LFNPDFKDMLCGLSGVEFDAAWHNRLVVKIDGLDIPVIGRNDLVVNKRATGRPKDIVDAETLDPTDS